MTTFDERERAYEEKFRHDQELVFKVRNRRNKLLGLHVARELLGMGEEGAGAYAKEVVMAEFDAHDGAVAKVRADIARAGRALAEPQLQAKLDELTAIARDQVTSE